MGRLIKRTEIMTFLNTTPEKTTETLSLVGNGMTSGSYSYEANENNETYIVDDNATTTIDSYALALDGEMKCILGDSVYDYINGLRRKLATGTDAETTVYLVDKYEGNETDGFFAQKFNCSISISSYGGDGGATPTIGFKINVNGNPTNGSMKITSGSAVFTASNSTVNTASETNAQNKTNENK